jgi:ankyrin repeat protein
MQKKETFLLNTNGHCGWAALHEAIHQNDQKMFELLLGNYCNPNVVSDDGHTPLQLAIGLGAKKIVDTLLFHPNIDIDKITKKGTALHFAINNKKYDFIQLLIDNNASLYVENDHGVTPFQLCEK